MPSYVVLGWVMALATVLPSTPSYQPCTSRACTSKAGIVLPSPPFYQPCASRACTPKAATVLPSMPSYQLCASRACTPEAHGQSQPQLDLDPLVSPTTAAGPMFGIVSASRPSRRRLLNGVLAAGICHGSGPLSASAYMIDRVKADERVTFAEAQKGNGPLRVLWVGSGNLTKGTAVKNLFLAGNEVVALDLLRPDAIDLTTATTYASTHGYKLRFQQGDATTLPFPDGTFDAVVSSFFLCQDFSGGPEVVVSEIRRVLKPGGRFGFYEHIENIDRLIVDQVFGERSVLRVQAYPERTNVIAGIVRKV